MLFGSVPGPVGGPGGCGGGGGAVGVATLGPAAAAPVTHRHSGWRVTASGGSGLRRYTTLPLPPYDVFAASSFGRGSPAARPSTTSTSPWLDSSSFSPALQATKLHSWVTHAAETATSHL